MKIPFQIRIKWVRLKFWFADLLAIERRARFIDRDGRPKTGLLLLALAMLLTSCGAVEVGVEATSTKIQSVTTVTATNPVVPDATQVQPHTANPSGPGPDLVWLPYASGTWDSNEVIAIDQGVVGFSESPVYFELFYDYSPVGGRLAYGSEFWHAAQGSNRSVSDLWVYDYATGEAEQLLADNVGRALFSPRLPAGAQYAPLAAVVYNPELSAYDLAIVQDDGSLDVLSSCASPSFSWSPDGSKLAYEAWSDPDGVSPSADCQGVFIVSIEDRSVTKVAEQPPSVGGWHGDQPIWAEGQDALLLTFASPEGIFAVVPLDGSGVYTVEKSEQISVDFLPHPMLSLWSQSNNSVVGQTEGMFDPHGVWVYKFSQDMQMIESAYRIAIEGQELDLQLIGWWEQGESVLLRDFTNLSDLNTFGRAFVWSLSDQTWRQIPDNVPEIDVSVYPQDVSTGIPEVDRVLEAFLTGEVADRVEFMQTITVKCVDEEFYVGPPLCPEGTAKGTPLEVFPFRLHRATEFAEPDAIAEIADFEVRGLYAVFESGDGFSDEWWPAGEYDIVLVSAQTDDAIEIFVTDGAVVRIEFWDLTPVETLAGFSGDYVLPPKR